MSTTRNTVRTGVPGQARSPMATPTGGLNRRDLQGPVRPNRRAGRTVYRARIRVSRMVWIGVFLALMFVPLVLAPTAGGERRPWSKGGIWVELCLTSGLLGLSTLAATLVLPSRVKSVVRSFGIEEVLNSHRWLGAVTAALVAAHLGFILVDKPLNLLLVSPGDTGANRARAGMLAFVAMLLLCVLSFRRRKMGTRYAIWRWVHTVLAMVALIGSYMHIFWLNHLMRSAAERTVMLVILVAVGGVLANRWALRPLIALRTPYLVRDARRESPSVTTLVLTPAGRKQKPMVYRPGQFAWIRLDSPFGPLQGNPFSIASGEDSPRNLEFTIRNAGDFTSSVADLKEGRKVFVDGPYGSFNADAGSGNSLYLIAGGVGMAPMISILRSHAHRRDRRRHTLLMSARYPSELLFREELIELSRRLDLEIIEVISQPPDDWRGATGRIDEELLAEALEGEDLDDVEALICASGPMMRDVKRALLQIGVPPQQIQTEEFDMV